MGLNRLVGSRKLISLAYEKASLLATRTSATKRDTLLVEGKSVETSFLAFTYRAKSDQQTQNRVEKSDMGINGNKYWRKS